MGIFVGKSTHRPHGRYCLATALPNVDITTDINDEITRLLSWADTWLIDLNPTKTKCMNITTAHIKITPSPSFNGTPIEMVDSHKHLGLVINTSLTWNDHIDYTMDKVSKRIGILRMLKHRLTRSCLRTIYVTHIRSVLEYCDVVWDGCQAYNALALERLQCDCIRIITGLPIFCRLDNLYRESGFDTLTERRRQHRLILLYKTAILGKAPSYFKDLLTELRNDPTVRGYRHVMTFAPYPITDSMTYLKTFFPATTKEWNSLDVGCRRAPSLSTFKFLIRPVPIAIPPLKELPRYPSILYTRLKYACSGLNAHLNHSNIIPSPLCACATGVEDLWYEAG